MRGKPNPWWSALLLTLLAAPTSLHSQLVLSEFSAANAFVIKDSDGDASDWVEITNPGSTAVDLTGWSLTDDAGRPFKWRFPSTNLAGGDVLIVFCSDKDRAVAGAELHTNFKLSAAGEYLALVTPDGKAATEFNPFPAQPADVSYGVPVRATTNVLAAEAAPVRFYVPHDDSLNLSWTLPEFDDSGWFNGRVGLGFGFADHVQTDISSALKGVNAGVLIRIPFFVPQGALSALNLKVRYNDGFVAYLNGVATVARNAPVAAEGGIQADSLGDWTASGAQGFRDWFYGFYDRSNDADATYNPEVDFVSEHPNWGFNGSAWVLGPGNPPWDFIGSESWHPNGSNNGGEHWVIRRWVCQTSGYVECAINFTKEDPGCGNGVTLRVFQNGQEQLAHTLAFNEVSGLSTNLVLANLSPGDYVDFALDPTGTDSVGTDSCDSTRFSVEITQQPSEPARWNSTATAARSAAFSQEPETIDLTRYKDLLVPGTNWLAIHALNVAHEDPTFLVSPEVEGNFVGYDLNARAWFVQPTPGAPNHAGSTTIGPLIIDVQHAPRVPEDNNPLLLLARVTPTVQPVGKVEARYRVMFLAEQALTLFDDGKHGDGAAGDHLFGNWIPAEVSVSGQMVRYYVNAVDEEGTASRAPAYPDPRDSPQYFGTVVKDPRLADSKLPVLHWFLQNASGADTDSGARGSFFFEGEFYDNVRADLHGQSTRAFPKKSYDLDFNPGYKFRWSADAPRVGDLNLLTTWADKTFFRTILAYETYRKAGVPAHFAFVARVQRNGTFFSVANVVENGGEDFLERVGLDTQGALYSMQNGADSVAMAEKKSRKGEGSQDLQELVTGMGQSTATARQTYLYDNLDIPEIVNFLAARMLTADTDCCHKNYYLYRDSEGTGEWQALPWDVDLSFGRVWTCGNPCLAYFDERIFTNQALLLGMGNRVFTPFYETPALRQMVMRRFRSLMDELFQPPGTPSQTDLLRQRTTELRDLIAPDALLDFAKWGTWGTRETITQAVDRIWTEFLPGRRLYLYQTMSEARGGPVPAQQTADALVRFGSLEYRPASGNPAEEWLMLTNGNTYAVDISAWQLEGGVRFQFKPGTIIPGRATMYVSPDVKAFRSRSLSPKGGERRLVVGPYSGNLSAWGESLVLLDNARRVVSTTNYPGAPSTAQKSLRITEIFYNPDPLPSSPGLDPQLYEFIELRNTGSTALDLRGVRFSAGVEFDFSTGSITNLAPGARVVVAKNAAALALRYGSSIPVAGEYTGNLSNSGETLRLVDAAGEKILEFEYGGKMVPAADGHGFSLVVRDEALPWQQWELSDSWRLNGTRGGTPGTENTAAPVLPGILINEVLAHTDPPQSDAIEIYNPTDSPVDVGGWFLTDEFGEPRKFRIPSPTVLGAGQYVYFSEADFNPTPSSTGSFALRSDGDEAWLFSADPSGALTGYAQGFDFEATANGVSLGRHTNSLGVVDYVPQDELTLGRTNARPLTGPIVLSEIMLVPGTSGADTTLSYIELANITVTNAPLQHPVQLTNAWQVTAPVRFSFPTNVVLAPGGQVLLVGFDPEVQQTTLNAFRLRYGLPTDVLILGPWDGTWNLDEDVSLTRPDAANVSTVPYIPVEHIAYGQWTLPMNALPSSVMSLQRRLPAGYANEPGNWFVARPSPGAHNIEPLPQPPSVAISAPADGFAIATGAALEISIEATDPDNAVQRVEVFSDGQLIATLASAPYVHSWEPAQGAHHLQAVAYDIGGLAATSAVVQIAAAQATRFSATLVPAESIWKYMDDGVNRGSSWTAPGYNDKTWKSGRAEFGYGDAAEGRPEATQLSFGPSATEKYVTYYFRREFLATNTFALSEVTANLLRDDGAIVYLNGLPLFRSNMPEVSSYSQLALSAVSGADEARFFPQQLDRSVIKEGTNVVAVEVHQASRDSSDLSFDFSLTGSGTLLAPVILQHPHPTNAPSGSSVTLQVRAAETGPLEYTWTRDGMVLPGAKGTTLTLVNLAQTQAGVYRALVRNVAGEVWSESALVSVNTPSPQPGLDGLLVEIGVTAHLDASALLANDLDPQGGTLSLTGVDAVSAAGFPISLAQGLITYRSSATFVGPDSFKYSVAGSDGAVAQGRVEILVYSGELPETGKLLILRETDRVLLRFREEPGKRWVLQQSLDLSSWSDQQEAFIPAYGVWEYSVGEPAETARYYRVARK